MNNNGKSKNYKRKRLNSIILLLAFTAVMLIVSTYAWFSSQKNVTIKNLKGTVAVAEGLEISLNAKDWLQVLDLGTVNWETDAYTDNKNHIPTEFQPVSTDAAGLGTAKDLTFYKGTLRNSVNLNNVVTCDVAQTDATEDTYAGYYAFDIFLKNTTNGAATVNDLQLNYDSYVKVLQSGDGLDSNAEDYQTQLDALIAARNATGLQNTVRVAFGLYNGTAGTMDNQETILANTVTSETGNVLDSTSIWEPNAASHIESVLNAYNGDKPSTPITTAAGTLTFGADEIIPTFALKTLASRTNNNLTNIYNWKAENTDLAEQIALQTNSVASTYLIGTGVSQLITSATNAASAKWNTTAASTSVKTSGAGESDTNKVNAASNFSIPANAVCRLRVYVWLEGQDVDCLSVASHGGGVEVNLDIMKDGVLGSFTDAE